MTSAQLENFSEVITLTEHAITKKEDTLLLAKFANAQWEDNENDFIVILKYLSFLENCVHDGVLINNERGSFDFKNQLHFEFFYSIYFCQSVINEYPDNWPKIFEAICRRQHRERSKKKTKLSRLFDILCIINLNNFFSIDLLSIWENDYDATFANGSSQFDEALPFMHLEVDKILSFINFLHSAEKHDYFPSLANGLSNLSFYNSVAGKDMYLLIEQSNNEVLKTFHAAILNGLSKSLGVSFVIPFVLSKIRSQIESEMLSALITLSVIKFSVKDWDQHSALLISEIEKIKISDKENLKLKLVDVFFNLISFIPGVAGQYTLEISNNNSINYQIATANTLRLKANEFYSEDWFRDALFNLTTWDYNEGVITGNIQSSVIKLAQKKPELSLLYLNRWIENEDNNIKKIGIFKYSILELYSKSKESTEEWITKSFKSPNPRYHLAMHEIISDLWVNGHKEPSLSKRVLEASSEKELKYILYKILGYIFSKEPLESLIFSILYREPQSGVIDRLVKYAFLRHIFYNYGGTYSFLKSKETTPILHHKKIVNEMIFAIDKYSEAAKLISNIKELTLSNRAKVNFMQLRMKKVSKEFRNSFSEFQENSFLSSVKNINLKGGKKFFGKYHGKYSNPSELSQYGNSFELPIGESIDPVKQKVHTINFRKYTLEK